MAIQISVLSDNPNQELALARELEKVCPAGVETNSFQSEAKPGAIVLIDGLQDGSRISDFVKNKIDQLDRRGRAIYMAVSDKLQSSPLLETGWVDDVLVYPFRRFEIRSRLKTLQQILMWEEVHHLNASVSQALEGLREDLKLAERLQKRRLPIRFVSKGLQIHSRYLAGMKSGGDFFDLAESEDQQILNLMMTDASSYGLSSAVLAILAKLSVKLTLEEKLSPYRSVQKIYRDLLSTLSEKDHLSLIFGRLDKRRMELTYTRFGSISLFHFPRGKTWNPCVSDLPALTSEMKDLVGDSDQKETKLFLEPGDQLLVLSDGFSDAVGGESQLKQFLADHSKLDGQELLNEFAFQLKKKLPSAPIDDTESDPMPDQDCSAMWIQIEAKTIRLARN